jgi:hypothetical protein
MHGSWFGLAFVKTIVNRTRMNTEDVDTGNARSNNNNELEKKENKKKTNCHD